MTSSNGNIFRVTGPLCGEFTGPGEFPTQRPVTLSFDVFFDLRLNKRLSKQPWGWWFKTLSCPLWRHGNNWYRLCHLRKCVPQIRRCLPEYCQYCQHRRYDRANCVFVPGVCWYSYPGSLFTTQSLSYQLISRSLEAARLCMLKVSYWTDRSPLLLQRMSNLGVIKHL